MKGITRSTSAVIVLAATSAAIAQTPTPGDDTKSERTLEIQDTCTQGEASALSEIACELSNQLAAVPHGSLVVSAPIQSKTQLHHPGQLEVRIAAVVAGRLRRGAEAAGETANLAVARSLASSSGTLLHLQARLEDGLLRVEADVYPVPAKFWDRVRDPRPSPVFHAYSERRLDAELRSHLPAVPLVAKQTVKAKSPEGRTLALACADVDLDGATELVLVGRHGVHLARIRKGVVQPFASRGWRELSSVSPTPLREPIGSVSVHPGRYIDVGISDRAHAIRFNPQLEPVEKVGRRIPWPGGEGCARFAGLSVSPTLERCVAADDSPPVDTFGLKTDAIASTTLIGRDGRPRRFMAGRAANRSEVVIRDDAGHEVKVRATGAQLALGDVDGDGRPELVAGTNRLQREEDAVVVRSWNAKGKVTARLRIKVPLGVDAVAICPQPLDRPAPLAIAAGSEVWIVR